MILFLFRDDTPTIVLGSWGVDADLVVNDDHWGIKPVLFLTRPEEFAKTQTALTLSSVKASVEKLQEGLFRPENLDLGEAENLIRKPRAGAVDFVNKKLKRPVGRPPKVKRYGICVHLFL
jgi:hypothetical protein